MIDLANYTGPVMNTEPPPNGSYHWRFYCPVCERQFNTGGAIWRIPTYDGEYQEEVLAFPLTVNLSLVSTNSNGVYHVEIFAAKCMKCGTVYQAWRPATRRE